MTWLASPEEHWETTVLDTAGGAPVPVVWGEPAAR